jgi:hypothetical protein
VYYLPTVGPKAHEIGLPIRLGVLGQRKKDEWVHLEFEMNTNKYTIRGGVELGPDHFWREFCGGSIFRFSFFRLISPRLLDIASPS